MASEAAKNDCRNRSSVELTTSAPVAKKKTHQIFTKIPRQKYQPESNLGVLFDVEIPAGASTRFAPNWAPFCRRCSAACGPSCRFQSTSSHSSQQHFQHQQQLTVIERKVCCDSETPGTRDTRDVSPRAPLYKIGKLKTTTMLSWCTFWDAESMQITRMKALGHGCGVDEVTTANAAHQVNIYVADFERSVRGHVVHLNVQLTRFHLQRSERQISIIDSIDSSQPIRRQ